MTFISVGKISDVRQNSGIRLANSLTIFGELSTPALITSKGSTRKFVVNKSFVELDCCFDHPNSYAPASFPRQLHSSSIYPFSESRLILRTKLSKLQNNTVQKSKNKVVFNATSFSLHHSLTLPSRPENEKAPT